MYLLGKVKFFFFSFSSASHLFFRNPLDKYKKKCENVVNQVSWPPLLIEIDQIQDKKLRQGFKG